MERYNCTFKDIYENTVVLKIYKNGYEGESNEILLDGTSPITITYEQGDNIYKPLKMSQCTVKVLTPILLDNLYTSTVLDTYCKIWKNDNLIWWGYLTPNIYTQKYCDLYDNLELEFIDSISALQYFDYYKKGDAHSIVSFLDVFKKVFKKVGIENINPTIDVIASISIDDESSSNILSDTFISDKNFGDEEDEPITMQDALMYIVQYYSLTLCQYRDKYYLYDIEYIHNNSNCNVKTYSIYANTATTSTVNLSALTSYQWNGDNATVSLNNVFSQTSVRANLLTIDNTFPTMDDMLTAYGTLNYEEIELRALYQMERIEKYWYNCSSTTLFTPSINWNGTSYTEVTDESTIIGTPTVKTYKENIFTFPLGNQPDQQSYSKCIYSKIDYKDFWTRAKQSGADNKVAWLRDEYNKIPWFSISSDELTFKPMRKGDLVNIVLSFDYMLSLWDSPITEDELDDDYYYYKKEHQKKGDYHDIFADYDKVWFCQAQVKVGNKYYQSKSSYDITRTSGGYWSEDPNNRVELWVNCNNQKFGTNRWLSSSQWVRWYDAISDSGHIIPISSDDKLQGKIEIKFFMPSYCQAVVTEGFAKCSGNTYEQGNSIGYNFIKNLKINVKSRDNTIGQDNLNKDLLYKAYNEDVNVKKAEDVEFYVNTYNPNKNNQLSFSYALKNDGTNHYEYISSIKTFSNILNEEREGIPEQLYCDKTADLYSTPKYIYNDVLKIEDIKPFNAIQFNHFNEQKNLTVGDITYDIMYNKKDITAYEL